HVEPMAVASAELARPEQEAPAIARTVEHAAPRKTVWKDAPQGGLEPFASVEHPDPPEGLREGRIREVPGAQLRRDLDVEVPRRERASLCDQVCCAPLLAGHLPRRV